MKYCHFCRRLLFASDEKGSATGEFLQNLKRWFPEHCSRYLKGNMGPDWSLVDLEDEHKEEEKQKFTDMYRGKKIMNISLPHSLVNGKNSATETKKNGDVDILEFEQEKEFEEEETKNEKEEEDMEDEDEDEDEEEEEEEESYREGQIFKSLLMLARYKSSGHVRYSFVG